MWAPRPAPHTRTVHPCIPPPRLLLRPLTLVAGNTVPTLELLRRPHAGCELDTGGRTPPTRRPGSPGRVAGAPGGGDGAWAKLRGPASPLLCKGPTGPEKGPRAAVLMRPRAPAGSGLRLDTTGRAALAPPAAGPSRRPPAFVLKPAPTTEPANTGDCLSPLYAHTVSRLSHTNNYGQRSAARPSRASRGPQRRDNRPPRVTPSGRTSSLLVST